ncbi:MFS transporter [Rhodococcus sp. NCIMB 12038]|uniref:MFS transporter n=1 Tax=Rhodococcus sp. NCIMB 12038 TaxID=933800 RepID=UPI000B3D3F32|nr:MFS transporter [Rhodococcus sp. NCIMB 12038]OUS92583.1 MFS transporter [Rhodococcus sp. NCIMB 12038]
MKHPADEHRATAGRTPLDRAARITVILLFAAWVVDYIDRLAINLALPSIGAEFGLGHTQQGMVISAFFLSYALCQIPGGLLADRFGSRRVVSWSLLIWSLFTALTGTAWAFAVLLAIRFVFGVGQGVYPAAAMKAVAERTAPGQRMTATGWAQSSNAFGAVLAPLIAAPIIAVWGWRMSFFAVAGLGVLVWAAIQLWLPATLSQSDETEVRPDGQGGLRTVLASGVMWRFTLMFFGYGIIVWGLNSWIPSYLQTERGISLTGSGLLSAIPALVGGVAIIVGGKLIDRLGGRHRVIVLPAMTVCAVCILFLNRVTSLAEFVALLSLATASATLCYMPIFAIPMRTLPAGLVGTGSGMINFGGQAAGFITPMVMGALVDRYSYTAAFGFLVVGAVLAGAFAFGTPQRPNAFSASIAPREPQRPNSPSHDNVRTPR